MIHDWDFRSTLERTHDGETRAIGGNQIVNPDSLRDEFDDTDGTQSNQMRVLCGSERIMIPGFAGFCCERAIIEFTRKSSSISREKLPEALVAWMAIRDSKWVCRSGVCKLR
ncbi:unnamed protein product [Linum tenue]|uniref:Uncharacterized protein n=1 Tax=Linum tenue TaxID=586396 RepID=A0AAV0HXU8_9ROSI|nr:unnamed protein product [Linum tenue]